MDRDRVKAIADGRIFSGKQARELELVDDFGDLEDAKERLKEELRLDRVRFITYRKDQPVLAF